MEISKKTIGFCLLIGRSCQDDVVDIGTSSAAAISDSFAAASDINSILVLLLYYYMMMLMRSLVVLSLFFDDEEQNQTIHNSQKTRVSLSPVSLLFLSLVIATNCTQTFFFILFFSKETILKVFASNKRIKHTHTSSHTHTHSKTNLSVFLWKSSSHPSVRFFSSLLLFVLKNEKMNLLLLFFPFPSVVVVVVVLLLLLMFLIWGSPGDHLGIEN